MIVRRKQGVSEKTGGMVAEVGRNIADFQSTARSASVGIGPSQKRRRHSSQVAQKFGVAAIPLAMLFGDRMRIVIGMKIRRVENVTGDFSVVGPEMDCLPIGIDGFAYQALIPQSKAKIDVSIAVGTKGNGHAARLRRLIKLAFISQSQAEIAMRRGRFRVQGNGAAI